MSSSLVVTDKRYGSINLSVPGGGPQGRQLRTGAWCVLSWGEWNALCLVLETTPPARCTSWATAYLSRKVTRACPCLFSSIIASWPGGLPQSHVRCFQNIWQEEAPSSLTLQNTKQKVSRTNIRGLKALNIPLKKKNVYLILDKNILPYL